MMMMMRKVMVLSVCNAVKTRKIFEICNLITKRFSAVMGKIQQ